MRKLILVCLAAWLLMMLTTPSRADQTSFVLTPASANGGSAQIAGELGGTAAALPVRESIAESATLFLLGTGLAGTAASIRRKRRRASTKKQPPDVRY